MSCIKEWIGVSRKCPQCSAKCELKDVRKLFASVVISVDEESQKRIRSLEIKCASLGGKCASFDKERAEWLKKEAGFLKEQGVLERRIHQLMESKASGFTTGNFERRVGSRNNNIATRTYASVLPNMQ